jgi:ATP-dependent Clp protease ATP-binding subunit ClpX
MYELPSSDDKTLVIDEEYAQETLKNLLKRLEISIVTIAFSQ